MGGKPPPWGIGREEKWNKVRKKERKKAIFEQNGSTLLDPMGRRMQNRISDNESDNESLFHIQAKRGVDFSNRRKS